MTSRVPGLAGRAAVALLFVLLAAGSVFAAATTRPAAAPTIADQPGASESAEPRESPDVDASPPTAPGAKAEESPDADESPEAEEADGSPSPENLARIVERLSAAGITATADQLAALAKDVGVGGAVRVLRFAKASGKTPAEIVAMFQAGKGWGVIARELKLDIGPGNGSVMGKGHGHDAAAKAAAKAARAAERAQRKAAGSGD